MIMPPKRRGSSHRSLNLSLLVQDPIRRPLAQSTMGLLDLLPSSLYTAAGASTALIGSSMASSPVETAPQRPRFMVPAPAEQKKIKLYSPEYYRACAIGGILSCGLTHTAG